jgi:hypothetical protein
VLDVQGHVSGEKVGMTIDTSALAHIMSVLTDLYSDPEAAVIREYSTNALDSHIEAGTKRPIEVTLPSPLSPFLRIRDYGIGLDGDGIRDIYSRYGTSTKRQSNDVVGMLGLGCKSALTYTDQFTLTGIKDGRMIQVLIGRDEDGAGSMTIVAEHDTDDLPGVEVTIPAKRHHKFESKAHEFFRFWQPGTVLVNGEEPKRIDGQWITDSILITTEVSEDTVVMGNVPYPVADDPLSADKNNRRPYYRRDHTVAFVPIGAVQFTPSREALQMTKLTKDTLEALKVERDSRLNDALLANIAAAETPVAAIRIWQQARVIGLTVEASYRGRPMQGDLSREPTDAQGHVRQAAETYLVATPHRSSTYRLTGSWQSAANIDLANIYFENFEGATFTATKRAKLDYYWAKNGGIPDNTARYVFVPGRFNATERFWLEGATVIDWATIDAIKLPRDPANPRKAGPRGAYKGRVAGRWDAPILAEKIDTSKPVLYYQGNRWSLQNSNEVRLGMIPEDMLVVCLEANRVEKFKRDFPMAQSVTQYAAAYVKQVVKGWDAYTLKAAQFQRTVGNRELNKLKKLTGVTDPAVVEGIKLATHDTKAIKTQLVTWASWVEAPKVPDNPLDKYPLLAPQYDLYGDILKHAVTYINAAHAAEGS